MKISDWLLPKNNSGEPKFEVSNLTALESTSTTIKTEVESIDTRLDETIGHINNLANIGSGSNVLKSATLGVMPSGNARQLSCSTEGHLNVDLQAGTLNVGDVDVVSLPAVQDNILTKITSVDTRFDNTISAVNNLSNLGAGSNLLKTASVGIMSGGNARILACSDSGSLNVNVASGAITGFSTSAKQDTIIGHVDGLETLVTQLDVVADNSLTKLTQIDTAIDTIDAVLDASLVKQTNLETLVTQLDVVADASLVKHTNNETLLTAISADGNAIQTLLTQLDVVADASLVKHTNNETLLTAISTDGNNIQTLLTQLDVVADASLVKQTNIETLITTLDGVQDSALTKLGEIDTAIDTIDSVLDASLVKQTNIETLITTLDGVQDSALTKLTEIDTAIDTIDSVLDASLVKQTNLETLVTQLDVVADNSLTKLTEIDTAIDTIDSVLDAILVQNTASEVHLSSIDSLARTSIATGSASLDDNEAVGAEDVSKFAEICVMYATSATHSGKSLTLQGATTSGGTYYNFAMLTRITLQPDNSSTDHIAYIWGTGNSNTNAEFIPCPYPFINVINQTGAIFGDSDSIRIIGR